MKRLGKDMISFIGIFILTALCCLIVLLLTGMIPQEAIKEKSVESAEYFCNSELYPYVIKEQFNTRWDNYADNILVNIMYHVDQERLLSSLLEASYYQQEGEYIYESFLASVQEEKEPNNPYFRYWHGMQVFLRPLFLITDIEGTRIILGIFLLCLTLLTSVLLIKNKEKALGIIYLLGNVFIQSWVCFFCIEYISTFLIMNIITIFMIRLCNRYGADRTTLNRKAALLFCISGVTTCFFDFLTTETLTVTIPLFVLLIFVWRSQQLKTLKQEVLFLTGQGIVWGISYGMMFTLKWILASIVLGKAAFGKALESAAVRMTGTVSLDNGEESANFFQRLLGAIGRNQGCLFPLREDMRLGTVLLLFGGMIFIVFAIIYLLRGKNFSMRLILLLSLLCLVPYARYMVLANHAYIHFFFTYRAQLILVLVLLFCAWEFAGKSLCKATK
ncbi:MAG: hypothetical protein IKW28_03375 [Lachnospiraceae bacterium]|nr:hypothetical protein [Lachnospiraceae bacterium]